MIGPFGSVCHELPAVVLLHTNGERMLVRLSKFTIHGGEGTLSFIKEIKMDVFLLHTGEEKRG